MFNQNSSNAIATATTTTQNVNPNLLPCTLGLVEELKQGLTKKQCPNCGGFRSESAVAVLIALTVITPLAALSLLWFSGSEGRLSIAATLLCALVAVLIWGVVFALRQHGRLKQFFCSIRGYEWNSTDIKAGKPDSIPRGNLPLERHRGICKREE